MQLGAFVEFGWMGRETGGPRTGGTVAEHLASGSGGSGSWLLCHLLAV